MAWTYSEFVSSPANIIADIKTKVLLSSDWSNPTGNVLVATCPNGATMAVDLGTLPDNQHIAPKAYRLFSAGAGTDPAQRYLYWSRNNNGITSANPLHVKVSAGNTLLYIEIEGPQGGEAGADNATNGSYRHAFFLSQLTAYLTADTQPAVVCGGHINGTYQESASSIQAFSSRNQGNSVSWAPGKLATLTPLDSSGGQHVWTYNPIAGDGSVYLLPYVMFEDANGIRGRLTDLFFAGYSANYTTEPDTVVGLAAGQQIAYNGNTYKVTQPYRTEDSGLYNSGGALGLLSNSSSVGGLLVAVRVA